MSNLKLRISLTLLFVLLFAFMLPVLAQTTYNPGVSVGKWVEYGNFVSPDNSGNSVKSVTVNVTAVNGKEVTIREHWVYNNGTTEDKNRVFNVETGLVDGQSLPPRDLLIPANLKDGDAVPPASFGVTIGSAENRTYLGVSRIVNIIHSSSSGEGYTLEETFVYDRVSGIRLESLTNYTLGTTSSIYSHKVVGTNIFGSSAGSAPETPTNTAVVAAAALIDAVLIIAVVIIALKRK